MRFLILTAVNIALPFLAFYLYKLIKRYAAHKTGLPKKLDMTTGLKLFAIGVVLLTLTLIYLRFYTQTSMPLS